MKIVDQRMAVARLAAERGLSLASLSAMLRRNPAYLQQFVARGSPRELAERDRRLLADVLGVDEAALGGEARRAARGVPGAGAGRGTTFRIPRLDLAASAGPGAFVDAELIVGTQTLDPALARTLGLREGQAGIIRVQGTSMEPALRDGDHLVVDLADQAPGKRPAIYVVRIGDGVMVKRVARLGTRLVATSDNPAADPIPDAAITVIGRVVWRMGRPD